jgi:hypothetical protein
MLRKTTTISAGTTTGFFETTTGSAQTVTRSEKTTTGFLKSATKFGKTTTTPHGLRQVLKNLRPFFPNPCAVFF